MHGSYEMIFCRSRCELLLSSCRVIVVFVAHLVPLDPPHQVWKELLQ